MKSHRALKWPWSVELESGVDRWEDDGGAVPPDIDDSPAPLPTLAALSKAVEFGLNSKAAILAKPVYSVLRAHQMSETDWEYRDLSEILAEWYVRFNERFRLQLPPAPLRLDPNIRRNCAGYFLPGHNEFGLVYKIAIRVPAPEAMQHLDLRDTLGTLLHEQLHLLQELTGIAGRNNYHNTQFRATAQRFGLSVNSRGFQSYDPDSPFTELLTEFGIPMPQSLVVAQATANGSDELPTMMHERKPSKSKLRKWSCGCTNVWVGVSELRARCTRSGGCGRPFIPAA